MDRMRLRFARRHQVISALALVLVWAGGVAAESGSGSGGNSGSNSGSGSGRRGNISQRVRTEMEGRERDGRHGRARATVDVIVRFRNAPREVEKALVNAMREGGEVRRQHLMGWTTMRLPAKAVEGLSESSAVEFVASDAPLYTAMDAARATAGLPPPEWPESAFKGNGVTIAMIDSGVALHPEIDTLVAAVDFVTGPTSTSPESSVDPNGHGTHVAGIMVGDGSRSRFGRLAGIAPQSELVSLRVLDPIGSGRTSDMLAALDWVLIHKEQYGIRVLNLSLGHPVYEPAGNDPLVQAVEALWDAGVVVVCSAGNLGRDGHGTITSPCNSRKVISVGALNDRNTADLTDDTVATYSSRGPTLIDGVAKPDLLAPGNRVVSARAPGSHLDQLFPDRRVADDLTTPWIRNHYEMSGTSMAAPVVSGAVALMLEQDPTLNPATVKARLMRSARKAAAGDPFAVGAGVLDILGALQASGQVAQAPSPRAIPGSSNTLVFEDTGALWSNTAFSLQALWSSSVLWSAEQGQPGLLRSEGMVCPTTAYATLWPEAALWPEATLWPESTLWSESVLWSDELLDLTSLGLDVADP
jgi:serine protease AprX